jgi:hypothetical protein
MRPCPAAADATQAHARMPAGGAADGYGGSDGAAQAFAQELTVERGGPSTSPLLVREHSAGT